jgi:lambda repressor-like predicted transcriptional regulator
MDTKTQSRAASIGATIKRSGHTLFSIAEATGIPRTTLRRRLLGTSPFNTDELDLIAAVLDVKVTDLLMEEAA